MSYLLKAFIGLFLLNNLLFASETPSFVFSEKEGLQPLEASSKKQKSEKEDLQPLTTSVEKQKEDIKVQKPENKVVESDEQIKEEENQTANSFIESSSEENTNSQVQENSISESFAPQTEEQTQETNFWDTLLEDTSWFFQEKRTKHKIAIVPIASYNQTQSVRLGLRFFTYSSDQKGYYFALSGSKYLFRPFNRFDISYIGNRKGKLREESSLIYDNHYENYFGEEGMNAQLSDLKLLYAHRLMANYKISHQILNEHLYAGLGAQVFFRKERLEHQEEKKYFDEELFLFLKAFINYDSRDNWKDPKKGVFHQLSFGCKPILDYHNSYCKGEGDLRFYLSLFKETSLHPSLKNSVLALRAFAGSSLFSPSSYSMAYNLGRETPFQGLNTLRGFKQNRFRGDKIYLAQTEIRLPLWENYLAGVAFAELGEVSSYKENFTGFVIDYGGGFRIGLPPDYDMKLRFDVGIGYDRQKKKNYSIVFNAFHAF